MIDSNRLNSPAALLEKRVGDLCDASMLHRYEKWWREEGLKISEAVDRAGTPHLRMFDRQGRRIDELQYPPGYWRMLEKGYAEGAIWRTFEEGSLLPFYQMTYLTAFFDAGLGCPYTVSLSTALPLSKYGTDELEEDFLPAMLRRDHTVWQGATWMTEIRGGSDLGSNVETTASLSDGYWQLTGSKYFASNVGAELAVVAARPEGAAEGLRGLGLFLVPKYRKDGKLNYNIRRLKDKIGTRSVPTGEVTFDDSLAYLLGRQEWGVYLILEVLNISRVANAVASAALLQRALAEAASFASERRAFGKPVIDHPLLREQFETQQRKLEGAFALAWEAVYLLEEVWPEKPPYSERYHLFRLMAHLAKYWTAKLATEAATWVMEVHGGIGTLREFPVERLFREAIILSIWEGTSHRQILDGLEVIERKRAHRSLIGHLSAYAANEYLEKMTARIDDHLSRSEYEKEASAEDLFQELASFTANALVKKYRTGSSE